jgi:hypothetical protein
MQYIGGIRLGAWLAVAFTGLTAAAQTETNDRALAKIKRIGRINLRSRR